MKANKYKQQQQVMSVLTSSDPKIWLQPEECGSFEASLFTSRLWILSVSEMIPSLWVSPLYPKSRKVPVNSRGKQHPSWNTTEETEEPAVFTHIFVALTHNVPYCSFEVAWRIKLTVLRFRIRKRFSCGAEKGRKIRTSFEISVYSNYDN